MPPWLLGNCLVGKLVIEPNVQNPLEYSYLVWFDNPLDYRIILSEITLSKYVKEQIARGHSLGRWE